MSEPSAEFSHVAESNEKRFEYSPENPPPLDVLESKVFAVHSTSVLPKEGIMRASAKNIGTDAKWDNEPASFRPTIHFSLGEVVQEHMFSWDENPYAVVAPLKALKKQLINVYPNDTFVLGDYELTPDSYVLVPRGTDTSILAGKVQIVEYEPGTGIRASVDALVKEKDGWPIRMQPGRNDTGAIAKIDDVDINSADFFSALFEELPDVSYGTHVGSERGEAFRFGLIEQMTGNVVRSYKKFVGTHSLPALRLYRAAIEYNVAKLTDTLTSRGLPEKAMGVFNEKKEKLQGWMNIAEIDIEIREKYGRTLSRADEQIMARVNEKRGNTDELRATVEAVLYDLPMAPADSELSSFGVADTFQGMPVEELKEFIEQNESLFSSVDMPSFYTQYAIRRWLLEKDEAAHAKGIDSMLQENLPQIEHESPNLWEDPIFKNLGVHLTTLSNRLPTALNILRQPYVQEYLHQTYGITFPEGEPSTLESVLRAHPETTILFKPPQLELAEEEKVAFQFLADIDEIPKTRKSREEALQDFNAATSTALEMKWIHDRTQRMLGTMMQPMRSSRSIEEMMTGDERDLYQDLKYNTKNAGGIWAKVGLEEEFKSHFPHDDMFWQSDMSMLDIYKLLRGEKGNQVR